MGYTTNFEGKMGFNRALTVPEFNELKAFNNMEKDEYPEGVPDSWCQWVPTLDGYGLEWDGGEKFYEYAEWLEWLKENWLKPKGIKIQGRINYQGEEIGDVGYLEVKDDKLSVVELKPTGLVECPNCGETFKPEV